MPRIWCENRTHFFGLEQLPPHKAYRLFRAPREYLVPAFYQRLHLIRAILISVAEPARSQCDLNLDPWLIRPMLTISSRPRYYCPTAFIFNLKVVCSPFSVRVANNHLHRLRQFSLMAYCPTCLRPSGPQRHVTKRQI